MSALPDRSFYNLLLRTIVNKIPMETAHYNNSRTAIESMLQYYVRNQCLFAAEMHRQHFLANVKLKKTLALLAEKFSSALQPLWPCAPSLLQILIRPWSYYTNIVGQATYSNRFELPRQLALIVGEIRYFFHAIT